MAKDKTEEPKVCKQAPAPNPEPDDVVEPEPEAPVLLTRNHILACQDQQTRIVAVPEWGGSVMVWGMTGGERDSYEQAALDQRTGERITVKGLRSRLVVMCVRDAGGRRLFTAAHIPALALKSAAALDRVANVAAELSGLSDSDMEEMVKNSDAVQSDDSGLS